MLYLKEKLTDAVASRLLFGNFLENLSLVIKTQTLYKIWYARYHPSVEDLRVSSIKEGSRKPIL